MKVKFDNNEILNYVNQLAADKVKKLYLPDPSESWDKPATMVMEGDFIAVRNGDNETVLALGTNLNRRLVAQIIKQYISFE